MQVDICCVGHITIDTVVTPEVTVQMPGGTAFYFSSALANMGAAYLLVTALAEKDKGAVEELAKMGITVRLFPSPSTTWFENRYGQNPDERSQSVLQQAASFNAGWMSSIDAKIFHLGSLLAGDFSSGVIASLAKKGRVSLDVQGFLRRVVDTQVVPADWEEKRTVLPLVHYIKLNEEELATVTGQPDIEQGARTVFHWGAREVIVTLGSKGSVVFDGTEFHLIPAFLPQQLTDATGCGDTYMAGYLFLRSQGKSIEDAGRFGAAMATLKLEKAGPFTGTRQHVESLLEKAASGY